MKIRTDAWLLRCTERFAHWTQDWFGVTSYRWCQVYLLTFGIIALLDVLNYFMPSPHWTSPQLIDVVTAPMLWCYVVVAFHHFQRAQARWQAGEQTVQQPPLFEIMGADRFFRCGMLALLVLFVWADLIVVTMPTVTMPTLTVGSALHTVAIAAVTAYAYMGHVYPKPFQRKRVLAPIFGGV